MPPPTLVILGGPGAGAIVAESVRRLTAAGGTLRLVGFLNDALPAGMLVSGGAVLGPFAAWTEQAEDAMFLAPLHKAKEMPVRAARLLGLGIPERRWARVVDPLAAVADDAEILPGSYVGAVAVVEPGARLGRHVALWPGAQLGHDAVAEDFVFVGRNAVVSGRARLEEGAHVGPGAVVGEDCRIGRYAVIGAGAVALRDVPDYAIMLGNPARQVGRVAP